ncbi:Subtilisin NAT [subsurface metagenome]
MKKRILMTIGILVLFLSFTATISFAGNWIINSKSNKLPKDLAKKIEKAGGKLVKSWDFIGIAVAEFVAEGDARAFETEGLKVMPDVRINWLPDEEEVGTAHMGEDETFYGYQWHLPLIEADKAWDEGVTGAGVRVAVLDTGIWEIHADLDGNIDLTSSTSFVPYETDIRDHYGHGTHVAGIIAAEDNAMGSIGVAPYATLIAVKVLDSTGGGDWSWILNGIIHAVDVDADIINMSLRGYIKKSGNLPYYTSRDASQLLAVMNKTLNWAASQDVLVITAAGNESYNLNHIWENAIIPSEAGNCIAVSATGPTDLPAYYTNYGTSVVSVAAPGGDFSIEYPYGGVLSTIPPPSGAPPGGHWYSWMQGTSMAAPCAAGVAALIISKYGPMSVGRLKNHLAQTADDLGKPGKDHYYGRGRVNAYKAVTKK